MCRFAAVLLKVAKRTQYPTWFTGLQLEPRFGAWNMMGGQQLVNGATIVHWGILNLCNLPPPAVGNFGQALVSRCRDLGVQVSPTTCHYGGGAWSSTQSVCSFNSKPTRAAVGHPTKGGCAGIAVAYVHGSLLPQHSLQSRPHRPICFSYQGSLREHFQCLPRPCLGSEYLWGMWGFVCAPDKPQHGLLPPGWERVRCPAAASERDETGQGPDPPG